MAAVEARVAANAGDEAARAALAHIKRVKQGKSEGGDRGGERYTATIIYTNPVTREVTEFDDPEEMKFVKASGAQPPAGFKRFQCKNTSGGFFDALEHAGYKPSVPGRQIGFAITINMSASPLSATTPRSKLAAQFKVKVGSVKQLRKEQQN